MYIFLRQVCKIKTETFCNRSDLGELTLENEPLNLRSEDREGDHSTLQSSEGDIFIASIAGTDVLIFKKSPKI
jgi:hypothetical protein